MKHSEYEIVIAGHTGQSAVVLAALEADDPKIAKAALGAAARLKILQPEHLAAALNDSSQIVKLRALSLAARLATWHTLPENPDQPSFIAQRIVGMLDKSAEQGSEVTEAGAFALGELGHISEKIEQTLTHLAVEHAEPLCREAAVAALGALGIGLQTILGALNKPALNNAEPNNAGLNKPVRGDIATVRRRAVIALAPFEGPEIENALTACLTDRDWQVRQAAEDLLEISEPESDRP